MQNNCKIFLKVLLLLNITSIYRPSKMTNCGRLQNANDINLAGTEPTYPYTYIRHFPHWNWTPFASVGNLWELLSCVNRQITQHLARWLIEFIILLRHRCKLSDDLSGRSNELEK